MPISVLLLLNYWWAQLKSAQTQEYAPLILCQSSSSLFIKRQIEVHFRLLNFAVFAYQALCRPDLQWIIFPLSLSLLHSGLNSILFAINIDNSDLNGTVVRAGSSTVSHLLKESTQGIGSLWKESTQGVTSLLREISTATAVVPGFTPRVDGASDPLPVLPRSTSAGRKQQHLFCCSRWD